ncbi:NAD-dependent succinate-semialdehyde dehydrogenase [Saccharopolyspora karakumensis]|uniref:NAD-dependent succinate-semialdehyde dehydrogenase n=1 Tax=Saccharopolyspora karakumensis TaxID=2530386 RepID=A0A4R5BDX7_9PSEU|nr:NAD-dependent succinate-semialdehyde dehydrogenase [Saccharopolyspora karakumensis]TDD83463.1 NAD-dependent succinate-semialdehyde dehydrogenase [Saccharopolyspora karakumensis]
MPSYAVTNPMTGEVLQKYPRITDSELGDALDRAGRAHDVLSRQTSLADRIAIIRRVAQLYRERADELGRILSREMGKPLRSAIGEANFSGEIYDYFADHAEEALADRPIALSGGTGSAFIRRNSIGVLLGVMPWNYPYYQVTRFAGPNLLIGNPILLKPSVQCPESALAMVEIFQAAGLPEGAFQSVFVGHEQVSTVVADPRVQGVSVTGSERAGSVIAEQAGRHLKKVVLELGGSDPFIVLSTDDLDAVVTHAVGARAGNTGQACNGAKRFIVIDELYDAFVEKFSAEFAALPAGDPTDVNNKLGPLSSPAAADGLEEQVKRAVDQGATVVTGGTRVGNMFAPTVLTGVEPGNDAYGEEFFGPVAQIFRVSSEEEAVRLANDTEFGLGSYLFTTDPEQADRVADRIEAGMVFVNGTDLEAAELPFGGVKKSGFGRELGPLAFDEFVNNKLVRIAR